MLGDDRALRRHRTRTVKKPDTVGTRGLVNGLNRRAAVVGQVLNLDRPVGAAVFPGESDVAVAATPSL
jgi:hypothetical protein